MKAAIVFFAAVLVVSCGKSHRDNIVSSTIYQGKVLKSVCGNIAVQLTDGSTIGQSYWLDPSDSIEYVNVFKVANPCNCGPVAPGATIRFRLVAPSPQNCVQCLMWVPVPDTAHSIVVVP